MLYSELVPNHKLVCNTHVTFLCICLNVRTRWHVEDPNIPQLSSARVGVKSYAFYLRTLRRLALALPIITLGVGLYYLVAAPEDQV